MKLGFYSEIARSHVVSIRKIIFDGDRNFSKESMFSIRKSIKESSDADLKRFLKSRDFYSTSALRDLIFHVKEHRFNLIEIKQLLVDFGLEFCGFHLHNINSILKDGKIQDIYDLHHWHDFETRNPETFVGMYQFWVQKKTGLEYR